MYSTARVVLTAEATMNLLHRAGFTHVYRAAWMDGSPGAELDDREGECFFVGAIA